MSRTFRAAIGIFALLTFGTVWSATGVAFVHGTRKQTDALNDYWTSSMVNSVRQGLPNSANYVVINCDFEQYMWDSRAAGCLAGQLHSFINSRGITDLVVLTHSNGGNVIRWIMSNPTWDSRYPAIINSIRWVNALAPSSLGTPLADAVMPRWAGCSATKVTRCACSRPAGCRPTTPVGCTAPPADRRCRGVSGT